MVSRTAITTASGWSGSSGFGSSSTTCPTNAQIAPLESPNSSGSPMDVYGAHAITAAGPASAPDTASDPTTMNAAMRRSMDIRAFLAGWNVDKTREAPRECRHPRTVSGAVEGRGEVGDQVIDAFDPDGQPHKRWIDLERRPGNGHVGHGGRDFDQRFHATQRLGQGEQARALGDRDRPIRPGPRVERLGQEGDHPPEPWVVDLRDVRTLAQECGHGRGIRLVTLDAQVQRS